MSIPEIHKLFLETSGISIDSRAVKEGEFYVALRGDVFDGNDFAEEALEKGAMFALVETGRFAPGRKHASLAGRIIEVDNALKTLQDLAHYHRKQSHLPILGITGTNGKTTTKELTAAVLSTSFRIVKTEGNLNNHIGVPLTLLRIKPSTQIAIVEMGANGMTDIRDLCRIAEPTHGLITNIGTAHLEGFGSKARIAEAKGELYVWLRDHAGVAFVNKNDKDLMTLVYQTDPQRFLNNVWYGNETVPESKKLFGAFNKENMKAAAAVGAYFKIKKTEVNKALRNYEPKNMRSERVETERGNDVILDAYNANPSSMKAALEAFDALATDKPKWLILGDMKELGEAGIREHKNVLWEIFKLGFTNVILIGEQFNLAHDASTKRYAIFRTKEDCLDSHLLQGIKRSAVLVKGSNGMKMWELVKEL